MPPGVPPKSGLPVGDLPSQCSVTVDMPTPRSALAVGAHPDDVEFGCGATLAKWAAKGCAVHHLILTDGSRGSWDADADPAQIAAQREREQRDAAVILGAGHVEILPIADGELAAGIEERRRVCAVLREVRPDVVLGHDPWRRYRLHPDHRNAGWLVVDAIVAARDPHFHSDLGLAPHRPAALLLFEPDEPNHVEDAGRFADVKIAALLAHRSQYRSTHGIDEAAGPPGSQVREFAERVRAQMASHGALAGLDCGEAFRLLDDI